MFYKKADGGLVAVNLVDTTPVVLALTYARDSTQPHEQEYLWAELNKALSDLRTQAAWLAQALRKHDELQLKQ